MWNLGAPLPLYLLHEYKKRLAIVLPLLRQVTLMRKFVTTHIHRQLKAICVQIAEIIHTCQEKETAEAGQDLVHLLARSVKLKVGLKKPFIIICLSVNYYIMLWLKPRSSESRSFPNMQIYANKKLQLKGSELSREIHPPDMDTNCQLQCARMRRWWCHPPWQNLVCGRPVGWHQSSDGGWTRRRRPASGRCGHLVSRFAPWPPLGSEFCHTGRSPQAPHPGGYHPERRASSPSMLSELVSPRQPTGGRGYRKGNDNVLHAIISAQSLNKLTHAENNLLQCAVKRE